MLSCKFTIDCDSESHGWLIHSLLLFCIKASRTADPQMCFCKMVCDSTKFLRLQVLSPWLLIICPTAKNEHRMQRMMSSSSPWFHWSTACLTPKGVVFFIWSHALLNRFQTLCLWGEWEKSCDLFFHLRDAWKNQSFTSCWNVMKCYVYKWYILTILQCLFHSLIYLFFFFYHRCGWN